MQFRRFVPLLLGWIGLFSVGCHFLVGGNQNASGTLMTPSRLEEIVTQLGSEVQKDENHIAFNYEEVPMLLIWDEGHDRMRIVAAVTKVAKMTEKQGEEVMVANFHTALDARYAVSGGTLYAAFIHPLSPLTAGELSSGIDQVAHLVKTYGSTYSGGNLVFRGNVKE